MQRTTTRQGFTIIELLIVVVVITVLAALTLVSYGSITARADDSSRLTTAVSFKKLLAMYHSEEKTYGLVGAPSTRQGVVDTYHIQQLADQVALCTPGYSDAQCSNEDAPYDKNKVYIWSGVQTGSLFTAYSYWSNNDKAWHYNGFKDLQGQVSGTSADGSWPFGWYGTN